MWVLGSNGGAIGAQINKLTPKSKRTVPAGFEPESAVDILYTAHISTAHIPRIYVVQYLLLIRKIRYIRRVIQRGGAHLRTVPYHIIPIIILMRFWPTLRTMLKFEKNHMWDSVYRHVHHVITEGVNRGSAWKCAFLHSQGSHSQPLHSIGTILVPKCS